MAENQQFQVIVDEKEEIKKQKRHRLYIFSLVVLFIFVFDLLICTGILCVPFNYMEKTEYGNTGIEDDRIFQSTYSVALIKVTDNETGAVRYSVISYNSEEWLDTLESGSTGGYGFVVQEETTVVLEKHGGKHFGNYVIGYDSHCRGTFETLEEAQKSIEEGKVYLVISGTWRFKKSNAVTQ